MTTMITNTSYVLPDPNDPESIETHKRGVLSEFGLVFSLIEQALQDSIPKATNVFSLLEGPVEPSVHAGLTRYLCKRFLASEQISSEDEYLSDLEVEQVANCGLCINRGQSQIRILKSTITGIPKATSDARRRFYSSNQYLLPFDRPNLKGEQPQTPLSLVVLWTLGNEYLFKEMEIACPRREREDGTVDCYWIASWRGNEGTVGVGRLEPVAADSDLDEIKPIEERKKATS